MGLFLRHLRESTRVAPIRRSLPAQILSSERPNFVVCPERLVFRLVLSLYMTQPDSPLPTSSEVLLCSSDTTTEDLELLFMRAYTPASTGSQKFYSILWINRLRKDTIQDLEESLKSFFNANSKLCNPLLIVSTADPQQDHDVFLLSALDLNPIDFHSLRPFISNDDKLQTWIKMRLRPTDPKLIAASSVDPEQCSVRLVTSEQAGMGKSVFVLRRVEQLRALLTRIPQYSAHLTGSSVSVSISMHQKRMETKYLMDQLFLWRDTNALDEANRPPAVIHLDVSREVREGLDRVLFALLILSQLNSRDGFVWLRNPRDRYIIENTPLLQRIISSSMRTSLNS